MLQISLPRRSIFWLNSTFQIDYICISPARTMPAPLEQVLLKLQSQLTAASTFIPAHQTGKPILNEFSFPANLIQGKSK